MLKASEYNINDIESCMNIACLPFNDCVGVTYCNTNCGTAAPLTPYCYVWDTCNFDNLEGNLPWTTLKKIGMFNQTLVAFTNL